MKRAILLQLTCLLFLFAACDSYDNGDDMVCTEEARPGISVNVMMDGGATPENGTLVVTVRDGDFEETMPVVDGHADLAYERAGTYVVEILQGQSIVWTRSDVAVSSGECHVNTVELSALLEPGS